MQRWNTHLDPTASKSYWTKDEDEKVEKNAFEYLRRISVSNPTFTSLFALTDSRAGNQIWHNKLATDLQAHGLADSKAVSRTLAKPPRSTD